MSHIIHDTFRFRLLLELSAILEAFIKPNQGGDTPMLPLIFSFDSICHESLIVYYWKSTVRVQ